jgi:hypothetical protein
MNPPLFGYEGGTALCAGMRIELSPHLDLWMRGARFGTVRIVTGLTPRSAPCVVVRMDNPRIRRLVQIGASECRVVRS